MARETGLELAVRSGGHSLGGHCVSEGGIVLDLRDLKAMDVDVDDQTAWADAGLTAADRPTKRGPKTAGLPRKSWYGVGRNLFHSLPRPAGELKRLRRDFPPRPQPRPGEAACPARSVLRPPRGVPFQGR